MEVNDYQENYVTGWVSLYRSLIHWEWFTDSKTVHLFIYCLLRANISDTTWRGIEIKKGQFITSLNKIALETGLSVQNVRTILKRLEKTQEINTQSNKQNTIVTICKYASYQAKYKKSTHKVTNDQHTTNTQLTTDNKYNNIISNIIAVLNKETNKQFRDNTTKTKDVIKARLNNNFTEEDFITVIKNKTADWKDNPKMAKFLRPETLFGNKFESYLNESKGEKKIIQRKPVWDSKNNKYVLVEV